MEETIINKILNRKTKRSENNLNINKPFNFKPKRPKLIQKKFLRKKRYSSNYYLTKKNMNSHESNYNSYLKSKLKIRENAVSELFKIFKENKDFDEKGDFFIKDLATKLEKELYALYPANGINYQKCLNNMNKTIKEIINYKPIIKLIIDKNINLFKLAIIPYSEELTKKINKIISKQKIKDKNNHTNQNENNPDIKIILNPHLYEPLTFDKINFKLFNPIIYDLDYPDSSLKISENEKQFDIVNSTIKAFNPKIRNEEIYLKLNLTPKKITKKF